MQMVWCHKCKDWTNLKNQVEKPFPPDHLVLNSVGRISLFQVFPLFFHRRTDVINARHEAISRLMWRNHFHQIILFSVSLLHLPLLILPPLLTWMDWCHKCQTWNNLKNQVEKPFPSRSSWQLFFCSLNLFGKCLLFYHIDFDVIKDTFWTISIGKQTKIIYLFIFFLFLFNFFLLFFFFLKTRMS